MRRGSSSSGVRQGVAGIEASIRRVSSAGLLKGTGALARCPCPGDSVPRDNALGTPPMLAERILSEQNQFGKAFLLDGTHLPFSKCIQIRTPWR